MDMHICHRERFVTAFSFYSVFVDPIANVPTFLAVAGAQARARKMRTDLEDTLVATMIMLFFTLCGAWTLIYLDISWAALKIAGTIILFSGDAENACDQTPGPQTRGKHLQCRA